MLKLQTSLPFLYQLARRSAFTYPDTKNKIRLFFGVNNCVICGLLLILQLQTKR